MVRSVRQQAERLYATFAELVRSYQYRDKEAVCCHGISVSQCHVLETLEADGPLTMGDLARRLFLDVSTMTRVVDQLVKRKLARRTQDQDDRRVWMVHATPAGRRMIATIQEELVREHEQILRSIPGPSRQDVIAAVEGLLAAYQRRQAGREAKAS